MARRKLNPIDKQRERARIMHLADALDKSVRYASTAPSRVQLIRKLSYGRAHYTAFYHYRKGRRAPPDWAFNAMINHLYRWGAEITARAEELRKIHNGQK